MTEKEIAQTLLPLIGGKENIVSVMHCATRLRIVVNDKDKIQVKEVENLEQAKGSFFQCGTVPNYFWYWAGQPCI